MGIVRAPSASDAVAARGPPAGGTAGPGSRRGRSGAYRLDDGGPSRGPEATGWGGGSHHRLMLQASTRHLVMVHNAVIPCLFKV